MICDRRPKLSAGSRLTSTCLHEIVQNHSETAGGKQPVLFRPCVHNYLRLRRISRPHVQRKLSQEYGNVAPMHELISTCAGRDKESREIYGRVWDALVLCMEEILRSGRGAKVMQVRKLCHFALENTRSRNSLHRRWSVFSSEIDVVYGLSLK